jgi:hypothetical protein
MPLRRLLTSSARALLLTLVMMLHATLPGDLPELPNDTHFAEYEGGVITVFELRTWLELNGSECLNCPEVFVYSSDSENVESASDHIQRAMEEILWTRETLRQVPAEYQLSRETMEPIESRYLSDLGSAWLQARLQEVPPPITTELIKLYDQYRNRFERPLRRHIRYIYIAAQPGNESNQQQAAARLRSVRDQIVAGAIGFESAAKIHSEAPSAAEGGSLGLISRESPIGKPFLDLAFSLPIGGMSDVVNFRNGAYLLECLSESPEVRYSREQVSTNRKLQEILLGYHQVDVESRLLAEALERYPGPGGRWGALARQAMERGFSHPDSLARRQMAIDRMRARLWAFDSTRSDREPTEEDILEFYRNNPELVRESGLFKVQRLHFPRLGTEHSTPKSPTNRSGLIELAESAREQLSKGLPLDVVAPTFAEYGAVVLDHEGWVQSTGDGPTDRLFAQSKPGTISPVAFSKEGVDVFVLRERRVPPLAPIDQKRDYIRDQLRFGRYHSQIEADAKRLAQSKGLTIVIPRRR